MNEISAELKKLGSPLAGLSRRMPFDFPENYLNSLPEDLYGYVRMETAFEGMPGRSKEVPFEAPEGYFSHLPELLASEVLSISFGGNVPLPYEVAPGYFESLPAALLDHAGKSASVSQKPRRIRLWSGRPVKWAAAAILFLSLCLGAYQYTERYSARSIASRQLLQLNGDDINNYMEQQLDEFDIESLETAVATSKTDLNAALSKIEVQDIQNYLDQTDDTSNTILN